MLFSKRKGFVSVRDTIQKDSMDEPLRSGLWNAMHICIWKQIEYSRYEQYFEQANVYGLFQHYWHNYFKRPLDNLPHDIESAHRVVRKYFFECKWYEAYDFIEFTASYCPENMAPEFIKFCNHIFEKERIRAMNPRGDIVSV
ncbi:MAG: AbiJ-NTD4 domain-containing protein [Vibrio litoralis]